MLPLLRWRTTTYTLTNHRLITRAGILNKVGHDVPVARITNVAYERSLVSTLGTLSLFYDVSKRLTLRARTGEDNAVDLIFTLPYD